MLTGSWIGRQAPEKVKLVKQPGAKVTHIARDFGIEQSVLRERDPYARRVGVADG